MARFHRATVLDTQAPVPELTAVRAEFQTEPENLVKIDPWLGGKLRRTGELAEAQRVLTGAVEPAQQHNMQRELGLISPRTGRR